MFYSTLLWKGGWRLCTRRADFKTPGEMENVFLIKNLLTLIYQRRALLVTIKSVYFLFSVGGKWLCVVCDINRKSNCIPDPSLTDPTNSSNFIKAPEDIRTQNSLRSGSPTAYITDKETTIQKVLLMNQMSHRNMLATSLLRLDVRN